MKSKIPLTEKFWSMVDVRGKDECWEWKSTVMNNGYGEIKVGGRKGKLWYSHRLAYQLTYGSIPSGMFVCHHCDNPLCCNPHHLFVGTNYDNVQDMISKGRNARGNMLPHTKINMRIAKTIRRLREKGVTRKEISNRFKISPSLISMITHRKRWI